MTGTEVNEVMDHLANKLAVPTSKLLETVPTLIYGKISTLITTGFAMIILAIVAYIAYKRSCLNLNNRKDPTFCRAICLCASVTALGLALVVLTCVQELIFYHMSPEGWSLNYIITSLQRTTI